MPASREAIGYFRRANFERTAGLGEWLGLQVYSMIQALDFSSNGAMIAGVSSPASILDGRCTLVCTDSLRTSRNVLRTRNSLLIRTPLRTEGKQGINTRSGMKTKGEWLPMQPCQKSRATEENHRICSNHFEIVFGLDIHKVYF